MAEQLALVATGLARTFLAIGISTVVAITKPRTREALIFLHLP